MKKLFKYIKKMRVIDIIIGFVIIFILLIFIDYFNILTFLGFNINNINFEFLSILTNSIVVILFFCITYKALDRDKIEKRENIKKTSIYMLEEIYNICKYYIEKIADEKHHVFMEQYINKPYMTEYYQNTPFKKEEFIFENIKTGVLTTEVVQQYFSIKHSYISFLVDVSIFYEAKDFEMLGILKKDIIDKLDKALQKLEELK